MSNLPQPINPLEPLEDLCEPAWNTPRLFKFVSLSKWSLGEDLLPLCAARGTFSLGLTEAAEERIVFLPLVDFYN
jgi:hypothetical protein